MATWEDGPEYAPLQRPDDFAVPAVPPLEEAAPYEQPAASAPRDRPRFQEPDTPVSALSTLVPAVGPQRDPGLPFEVVSSTMTSTDSAWSAAHWSRPGAPALNPRATPAAGPAPALAPVVAQAPAFPAPGTPGWFAPGAYTPPPPPRPVTARRVLEAATPGLVVTLLIGGVIYLLAPLTLIVAFGLAQRVRVAVAGVRRAFAIALGVLAFGSLLSGMSALLDGTGFGGWWASTGTWALLISWVVLLVTVGLVAHGLRNERNGRATW
ncbi:MAG: hypothetical protein ACLGIF_00920 [Actinomycetes bacterium]